MSGSHSQAAVARTSTDGGGSRRRARGPAGRATPVLRRQRARFLGLGAGQLITCEIAALAVLFSTAGPRWLLVASGLVAVALFVFALGRRRRRWLYEWLGVYFAFKRRRGRAASGPGPTASLPGDQRLALLREISPALEAYEVTARSGERVGVVGDGQGWSMLLSIEPAGGPVDTSEPLPVPLDVLANALDMRGIRLAGVQVVAHTVPPLPGNLPFVRSYQQLTGRPVPPRRSLWLALRLDPRLCGVAVDERGGGAAGAHRALLTSAARLAVALGTAGVPARLLNVEEALGALAVCMGAVPWQRTQGGPRTGEQWTAWTCDGVEQACFWVRKWPPVDVAGRLLTQLAEASGVPTAMSLTLTGQDDGTVSFRGMLRATGKADELAERLQQIAHAAGAGLDRLDGEHGPAVLATLPLGGGVR